MVWGVTLKNKIEIEKNRKSSACQNNYKNGKLSKIISKIILSFIKSLSK